MDDVIDASDEEDDDEVSSDIQELENQELLQEQREEEVRTNFGLKLLYWFRASIPLFFFILGGEGFAWCCCFNRYTTGVYCNPSKASCF